MCVYDISIFFVVVVVLWWMVLLLLLLLLLLLYFVPSSLSLNAVYQEDRIFHMLPIYSSQFTHLSDRIWLQSGQNSILYKLYSSSNINKKYPAILKSLSEGL